MTKMKQHLSSAVVSGLGFGVGFVLGALLSNLIFDSELLNSALALVQNGRWAVGLLLALVVAGFGGAVGGAVGGITLSYVHAPARRVAYAWRGALAFGIGYALVLIPLTLAVSSVAYYDAVEVSPIDLLLPFWLLGAIFGAVSGLIFGLLTVGRDFWRVSLVGAIAFAVGGSGLEFSLWGYLSGAIDGNLAVKLAMYAGLFSVGAIGGGGLGYLYSWLAHPEQKARPRTSFSDWFKQLGTPGRVATVAGLVFLFLLIRAVVLQTPFPTGRQQLATMLELPTLGTQWASPVSLVENGLQPALAGNEAGVAAIAWSQAKDGGTDVYYATRPGLEADWSTPVNLSNSTNQSTDPQIVLDRAGTAHLVWKETAAGAEGSEILYSRCQAATCTPAVPLSNRANPDCLRDPTPQNDGPALALDGDNTLLVSWRNGERNLLYSTWPATGSPPQLPTGCLPPGDGPIGSGHRVAAGDGVFRLVYEQNGNIYLTDYAAGRWRASPELLGPGSAPNILVDARGQNHVAWCGPDQTLRYRNGAGPAEQLPFPGCAGRPGLAQNENGSLWLVWHTDQAQNVTGAIHPNSLIFETFKTASGWSEPAIIAQTAGSTQPVLASAGSGSLHLAWADESSLNYTSHTDYDCADVPLSPIGQVVFDTVRQEKFRPATDPIAYCHNQYQGLIYVPNPEPAYSSASPTPNGPFDRFAELAKTAQYEVLFATMWYDDFSRDDNPGRVLAGGIAELYRNLKTDPARYPRGMTVRILLGNPPPLALFPNLNHQVWQVLDDLRAAGIPELENDAIGWKVEVANFDATWLHSHVKLMVVDGKSVQVAGYNMQHSHFPTEHPSGRGRGRVDLGLQVTGPVAQHSLRAFDDMWTESTRYLCPNFQSGSPWGWMFTCEGRPGVADHVPEVLRYFVPGQAGNAFSLYRSQQFRESDEAYARALASATTSIDIIHINFSLQFICALNIFLEGCTYANRIPYMDALMQAVENNGARVRVLVSDIAWVGLENNIAIKAFEDELAARGLSDKVEIRYFDQNMHMKTALIDDEFLIVGNQNFHYSAWGNFSLTEYNLGVEDSQAVQDYQRYFDTYWERAGKRE